MNDVCLPEKLSQNSHQGYSAKNGGSYPCLADFSPEIVLGLPEYSYDSVVDQVVARYYDATIGRFISPDIFVTDPTNPQSWNRYSYCLNNPLKYIDPSGHDPDGSSSNTPSTGIAITLFEGSAINLGGASALNCKAGYSDGNLMAGVSVFKAQSNTGVVDVTFEAAGANGSVGIDGFRAEAYAAKGGLNFFGYFEVGGYAGAAIGCKNGKLSLGFLYADFNGTLKAVGWVCDKTTAIALGHYQDYLNEHSVEWMIKNDMFYGKNKYSGGFTTMFVRDFSEAYEFASNNVWAEADKRHYSYENGFWDRDYAFRESLPTEQLKTLYDFGFEQWMNEN